MDEAPAIQSVPRRLSGFSIILLATLISGVASYLVTWLVPHETGLARYAIFAVFWSSIYLVVAALFGIQQEVTRATRPVADGEPPRASRARNFGAVAALVVFGAVVASAPLWVDKVFPAEGWSLVWPLAVGTGSFVMVAVLCGSLYGIAQWRPLALLMIADALLRLIAIAIVLAFTTDVVLLAWAVAIPFPGAIALLWPVIRRTIVGRVQLDVSYRTLVWNVSRTVVAAVATGVMVSGFPLILEISSRGEPSALLGLYILTITLTRAPLIVIAMSLQSYLIVTFRDNAPHFWQQFLRLQALLVGAGILLAGGGYLQGPAVFALLFPGATRPTGTLIAVLVLSSTLVGSLCISAPAVLARSQHFVYSAGWVVGACVTVAALLLPIDFSTRTVIALLTGPAAGIAVHLVYLVASRRGDWRNAGATA